MAKHEVKHIEKAKKMPKGTGKLKIEGGFKAMDMKKGSKK